MDIVFIGLLLVIQAGFIIAGLLVKAYIIPNLLSVLVGMYLIQGLVNENTIIIGVVSYLLPSYVLVPVIIVMLFPILLTLVRLTSRGSII